jgi:hypothetical protein
MTPMNNFETGCTGYTGWLFILNTLYIPFAILALPPLAGNVPNLGICPVENGRAAILLPKA